MAPSWPPLPSWRLDHGLLELTSQAEPLLQPPRELHEGLGEGLPGLQVSSRFLGGKPGGGLGLPESRAAVPVALHQGVLQRLPRAVNIAAELRGLPSAADLLELGLKL